MLLLLRLATPRAGQEVIDALLGAFVRPTGVGGRDEVFEAWDMLWHAGVSATTSVDKEVI